MCVTRHFVIAFIYLGLKDKGFETKQGQKSYLCSKSFILLFRGKGKGFPLQALQILGDSEG
jgi:hypothetical protein